MHIRNAPLRCIAAAFGIIGVSTAAASASSPASGAPEPTPLPRDLEIELALSSLPPHLRSEATVYVLDPRTGFEQVREGTNGFHALVARTGDDAFRGSWPLTEYRDDLLYPVAFDSAGAEAILPVFFDAARMQAQGTPAPQLKETIRERYASNQYKAPERAGISYMLSPVFRSYTSPDQHDQVATVNFPHVMHYVPNVGAPDIGGAQPGSPYPFLIHPGPHAYSVQAVGDPERQAINDEYAALIAKLCELRTQWCLPGHDAGAAQHRH
ncbi:hypothetical protein [Arenibaculum sp.]|uniref:hypothetical protein n=1 Tax=Arenibaculum sp. TaxID=2865862 RepID=UPI002E119E78|nr:hypothetical protein [Arenibaculum sp.]